MSSPLASPQWYRVCTLTPRLRPHVEVRRHRYRGRRWYVLEDRVAGRTHRLDVSAWQIVGAFNGQRPVDALWSDAVERLGDDAPTQDQIIQLLGTLHGADLMQCELPPDARELFERQTQRRRQKRRGALRSPFFVKLPLFDPEAWLNGYVGSAKRLFSPTALLIWLVLVAAAGVLAALHWPDIAADGAARLTQPANLLVLALIYPLVKGLHELGHALAVKAWGGEVHDTGVMLLVFMPVPYVDATAANAFESKWARMTVAGAGIAVELALAALALCVWLLVEPGLVRTLAFNVMVIGGISTVLFNGNPLLRFDGYFVLADALEIPNLAARASNYYGYLLRRYALGMRDARSPAHARGERRWFVVYGAAAFVYRGVILVAILLFVCRFSMFLGVVLGGWAVFGQIVQPTLRSVKSLREETARSGRRGRAALAFGVGATVAVCVVLLPMPQRSLATGVVWLVEDGIVRTGTDCFVERIVSAPGSQVGVGAALIECSDPLLDAQLRLAEARLQELTAKRLSERRENRNRGQVADDEVRLAEADVAAAHERRAALVVRSPARGRFVLPLAADLPGRFVPQGDTVGFVMRGDSTAVRVAVAQADIGLLRERTDAVSVQLAELPGMHFAARIVRELPQATRTLPSAALGTAGGGELAVDTQDPDGYRAVAPVFQLELALTDAGPAAYTGGRAYVRFDHGAAPLGRQLWQRLRQLLLRHLGV